MKSLSWKVALSIISEINGSKINKTYPYHQFHNSALSFNKDFQLLTVKQENLIAKSQ